MANGEITAKDVIEWAFRVLLAIMIVAGGFMLDTVRDLNAAVAAHTTDIRVIQETRFTAEDAHQLREVVRKDNEEVISEIKNCLNKIQLKQLCD